MSTLKEHLITKKESRLLAGEYEKSNYVAINAKRPSSKPDSKSYSYDLEVLQEYINLIRDGMEKQGIKNKGIKVTLGKYPDSGFDPRLDPLYHGYQTIFFSAVDLDPSIQKKNATNDDGSEELPDMNFSQLCPPY